jgi:hypothetical protein
MKIIKVICLGATLLMTQSCATLFYNNATFNKAPLACIVDIIFGFTIFPLAIDVLNGSCKLEGGLLNGALIK